MTAPPRDVHLPAVARASGEASRRSAADGRVAVTTISAQMTTQTSTAYRFPRTFDTARAWLASGRRQAMAALALYVAITIGYFGLHVLPHLGSASVGLQDWTDPTANMWSLAWWPYALLHGLNPFVTHVAVRPGPGRSRRDQSDAGPARRDHRHADHDRVRSDRVLQRADAGQPGAGGVLRLSPVPVRHGQVCREPRRRLCVRLLDLHAGALGRSRPARADLSDSSHGPTS